MLYFLHLLVFIAIYTVLLLSFDLLAGHAGMVTLCHGAFYAMGAYTTALVLRAAPTAFGLSIIIAFFVAGLLSIVLAVISTRLVGGDLLLATLGLDLIVTTILLNWESLTGGTHGIRNIPAPHVFNFQLQSSWEYLLVFVPVVGLAALLYRRVTSTPIGRLLNLLRDDRQLAVAFGKAIVQAQGSTIFLSCGLAGVAGAMYASYVTFIDPTTFGFRESLLVLIALSIGGPGTGLGALFGAALIVLLPELLRFLGISPMVDAKVREMIFGALLILIVVARPRGLVGRVSLAGDSL